MNFTVTGVGEYEEDEKATVGLIKMEITMKKSRNSENKKEKEAIERINWGMNIVKARRIWKLEK